MLALNLALDAPARQSIAGRGCRAPLPTSRPDDPTRRQRPSPDALLEQPRTRGSARPAEDLSRRRTRRRQDLRDADGRAAPGSREGVDVVVGVVETHGRSRDRRRCSHGLEVIPRRRIDYKGRVLEEMDLDAILARRPAARARRRARPHQRPRQPPPQALSRRRGAARRRHRRLHDAQHPACREPQRRRRADHPRPGARDGARLHHRPRRRHRGHRPHARRPDPAAEGGQGLRARRRRSGRSSTISRPAI